MEPELWIVTDAAGFIEECSPAALQLLGYSGRGVRGRELTNLFVSDRPRLAELLGAAAGGVVARKARLRAAELQRLAARNQLTAVSSQP